MRRPLHIVILLWWAAVAGFIVLSYYVPPIADSGLSAGLVLVRFFIPLRTRRMHWASVILFLAAMLLALKFSSASPLEGLIALLCFVAYFVLILVSDILQFVRKPLPEAGEPAHIQDSNPCEKKSSYNSM